MNKNGTLVYIFKDNKILLGCKKYGGAKGKLNGFGGKIEEGESEEAAAMREVYEETSLKLKNMELKGVINFYWLDTKEEAKMFVYISKDFEGIPTESKEMTVKWFDVDDIPKERMWRSDRYWFDFVLQEEKFEIELEFTEKWSDPFKCMKVTLVDDL